MRDTLATLAFSPLLLAAMLGGAQVGDLPAGLVTAAALSWGWWTRARFPGQGLSTIVVAVAMVALGAGTRFGAQADPSVVVIATDASRLGERVLAAVGLGALPATTAAVAALVCSLSGSALAMAAVAGLARARGRSAWWGILGVTNILGYGVLLWLPVPPPEFRV